MDHWGDDPWADDAEDADTRPPPKHETDIETPPPLPAPTQRDSVVWNGFLDDAQWGSAAGDDEHGGGGWAAARHDSQDIDAEELRAANARPASLAVPHMEHDDGGWSRVETETETETQEKWQSYAQPESEPSAASDSASTIEPDDDDDSRGPVETDHVRPDDDASTRSSPSPSDITHPDALVESPRTSFEDEQPLEEEKADETTTLFAEKEPKTVQDHGAEHPQEPEPAIPTSAVPLSTPEADSSLMAQLFPPAKPSKELPPAPDGPIFSTSARKAWYRLTRDKTMREFNNGGLENSYVRVKWATSQIKTEVATIVSRWAAEDRMSGRGPNSRASFYWDQPERYENPTTASRKNSVSSTIASSSSSIHPRKQRMPSLVTDVPAAFNWSSPTVAQDLQEHGHGSTRSVSSPLSAKPMNLDKVLQHEGRSVSVDLKSFLDKPQTLHKKTTSMFAPVTKKANIVPAPSSRTLNLSIPEKPEPPEESSSYEPADTLVDDAEEWGEMVESPTFSTPTSMNGPFSQNTSRSATLSTPSTTPKYVKTSPIAPLPKHSAPIVRLQGTVYSTSALFHANRPIPANNEQGPFGPGVLRPPTKRVPSEKSQFAALTTGSIDEVVNRNTAEEHMVNADQSVDGVSILESTVPQRTSTPQETHEDDFSENESVAPKTSTTTHEAHTPADPWSDADLSIFASAPPLHSSSEPQQTPSSDPLSIFDTPTLSPSGNSPSPKSHTVGLSISNSAQTRKALEDASIRSIVAGLPDLGYMLQQ